MCDVKYEDLPVIYDGQCQEISPKTWEIIMQMATEKEIMELIKELKERCDSDE